MMLHPVAGDSAPFLSSLALLSGTVMDLPKFLEKWQRIICCCDMVQLASSHMAPADSASTTLVDNISPNFDATFTNSSL